MAVVSWAVVVGMVAVVCAERELAVVTVATDRTPGYLRWERSCKVAGLSCTALGMGQEWQGGDMDYPGGGWKVNLLKEAMKELGQRKETVVMFTDSYDVVVTAGKEAILAQYDRMEAGILFGAENFCWPDQSLREKYPSVKDGMRFLNSGGFIGPAALLAEMLRAGGDIENKEDDQLFYTRIYIDRELRDKFRMKLDSRAELFQNLNGEAENVELRFSGEDPFVHNLRYNTKPLVIHGNGPSKLLLANLGNYLAESWAPEPGCLECWEDALQFGDLVEVPRVVMAVFVEKPTPFMEEFWVKLEALVYDKESIDLYIHNAVEFHQGEVEQYVKAQEGKYHSIEVVGHTQPKKEWAVRNQAIQKCADLKCDYLFVVDSEVQLDNAHSLQLFIEQNRAVVAPMLIRPYSAWSNFWGSLSSDGYYARSADYMEIVNNNRRGLWNVPFVSSCYLIQGSLIHDPHTRPSYIHKMLDPDMALMANLRANDEFIFVSNRLNFGHLVNAEDFQTTHLHNELWEIERNRYDWELRYLHPNYSASTTGENEPEQPCPDVYWFPIFTEKFCGEFIEEAEHFGKWSDGSNSDRRLEGGYEAVPTRDIHMNQLGLEEEWLYLLDFYIRPLQEGIFTGYFHKPPRSLMNFIVRYRPDEQPFLRPHHDSSTYTINVALNKVGADYEGGGCRFLRYDCQVTETKVGWMFMHPGRLTHYHEGLYTTKGTRYIMISFVDP